MLEPDFILCWKADELYPFPSELVNDVDIPEAAKSFLTKAGLPKKLELAYMMYFVPLPLEPESPPVQSAIYPIMSLYTLLSTPLWLFAYTHYDWYTDNDFYYAVEEKTGYVRGISIVNDTSYLINHSIPQFAESLLAYRDFMRHFRPVEPERSEIEPLITGLEQRWQEIDPIAMESPMNLWSLTIYDMRMNF